MAHVHIIDSSAAINCPYGRVSKSSNNTMRWTPRILNCGAQESDLPDYDSRFIGGDTESDFVVDGC